MKNLSMPFTLKALFTMVVLCFVQTIIWAQDSGGGTSSTSTTTKSVTITQSENWYTNPIVWVIGAAVFILLLVALTRGGGKRTDSATTDRVTVTKTVSRDTDSDAV
jgi:phage-related minor tail protein